MTDLKTEIDTKKNDLETLDSKIKNLKDFTSAVQLTIWRRARKKLYKELKDLKIRYDLTTK